jgi:transcriptional regulator with XRE-family HTH domain
VKMHDLVGKGAAAVRKRNGWTQEQAARAYKSAGLTSWQTGTVGSLEAGLRRPRLEEVILMCAALGTTLTDLVRAADENGTTKVTVAHGVTLSAGDVEGCIHPCGGQAVPVLSRRGLPPGRDFTDAERHASRRLGVTPAEVRRAAGALYGRGFDVERDVRSGAAAEGDARSRQARRGLVAREMLAEIAESLRP